MELRVYNVMKIYSECVKCRIGVDLGVDHVKFNCDSDNIRDMLSQIETVNGEAHLCACNRRKDGEIWTPYIQVIEMLILMGRKLGYVEFDGLLKEHTLVKIDTNKLNKL